MRQRDQRQAARRRGRVERIGGGVRCLLCDDLLFTLGSHLQHVHGISGREYRQRFPGAPLSGEHRVAVAHALFDDMRRDGVIEEAGRPRTCARGHRWTARNSRPNGDGKRRCRKCYNESKARWLEKNRERVRLWELENYYDLCGCGARKTKKARRCKTCHLAFARSRRWA